MVFDLFSKKIKIHLCIMIYVLYQGTQFLSHFSAHIVHSGYNVDFFSSCFCQGMEKFDSDLSTLHPILTECRVIKSDMELALIQYANDVSSEAHIEVTMDTA